MFWKSNLALTQTNKWNCLSVWVERRPEGLVGKEGRERRYAATLCEKALGEVGGASMPKRVDVEDGNELGLYTAPVVALSSS